MSFSNLPNPGSSSDQPNTQRPSAPAGGVGGGALRSEYANDPDMRDIVEMYVTEMPERIGALEALWQNQSIDELKRLSHQIKGASGGYGFPSVGSAAGRVEKTICQLSEGSGDCSMQDLRKQFEELLNLCRRVSM
jgi:histidine phosphotransfer protein HptB